MRNRPHTPLFLLGHAALLFLGLAPPSGSAAAGTRGGPSAAPSFSRACFLRVAESAAARTTGPAIEIVTSPEAYRRMLLSGERPDGLIVSPTLLARILRGTNESDFEMMSPDRNRRIIMYTDSTSLTNFLGKDTRRILQDIGYDDKYIQKLQKANTRFRMVVFENDGAFKPATWDNVGELVAQAYPEVAEKVLKQIPTLKKWSWRKIERRAKDARLPIKEIYEGKGRADPRFMSVERLMRSRGTPEEVRAFLYHELNLNNLFRGDGFVEAAEGGPGGPEFIGLNRRIDEIRTGNESFDLHPLLPPLSSAVESSGR